LSRIDHESLQITIHTDCAALDIQCSYQKMDLWEAKSCNQETIVNQIVPIPLTGEKDTKQSQPSSRGSNTGRGKGQGGGKGRRDGSGGGKGRGGGGHGGSPT
jgi:hypothetical protein